MTDESTSGRETRDIEIVSATDFQKTIADFMRLGVKEQKDQFPQLYDFIMRYGNKKILQEIVQIHETGEKINDRLAVAGKSALTAKYRIAERVRKDGDTIDQEQIIEPYTGRGVFVVTNKEGHILGATTVSPTEENVMATPLNPQDEDFAYAAALTKTLVTYHLESAGLKGGIAANHTYLKGIHGIQFRFHDGAVIEPQTGFCFGASECEGSSEGLKTLLDGATPSTYTQAGALDAGAAYVTAILINWPDRDMTQPLAAPLPLTSLTMGN